MMMLAANEHQDDTATDLSSGLAQPFEAVCSALAAKLTAQSERFDDLNARLSAMQRIVTRTMCDSSRDWNRSHDRLRVLPMELRAMCWSYLPQSDFVGLACVCSTWRDISRGMPSLWTTLDVKGPIPDLDVLFSRSGRQHFDVSVTVCGLQELAYVDDCVGKHAYRLQSLRISDSDVTPAGNVEVHELFRYPTPVLVHFSFKLLHRVNYGGFHLTADIFNSHAPNLRSLTLHEVAFPVACPALSRVTELNFQWRLAIPESGLEHVFSVSPSLESLALLKICDIRALPFVPPTSTLHKITLTAKTACFTTLRARGYLDIPRLEVLTDDPRALFHGAQHDDPSWHATLTIASTSVSAAELVLRSENGTVATFSADDSAAHTPSLLLEHAAEFPTLERLVLPSAAPYSHTLALRGGNRVRNPHIPNDLHVAALRTLVLAHGAYEIASLLDPTVLCGVIRAPQLSRLEIVRAANSDPGSRGVSDTVNPGHLALFIEQHIACGDPDALEVFVDAENVDLLDVADEEGMERLRRCVGKIIYGDSTA